MSLPLARRMDGVTSSPVRDLLALTARPGVISFAGDIPAPELFDVDGLRAAFDRALADGAAQRALQYSPTEGNPRLRELLAQRLSGRDFGFSLESVALFRAQWLAGGSEFADGLPVDLYVGGGAMLWGLVYNLAQIGMPLVGQFLFFFYPPQQMSQIIDYVKRQEPDSLTEDLPTNTKSETGEELRGLVLLRRKGDGHHLLALLYDTEARVLTIMGVLPEALQ